jgi:outer membrane protein TolC
MQLIAGQNPVLEMLREESLAYEAKMEMVRKMGYPMFGIGLQYMLIGKTPESNPGMTTMENPGAMNNPGTMNTMNGKDMIMPMVSVSIPVFRGKYKAARRETRLQQQATQARYNDAQNRLEAELYRSKHLLDDAARNIALYQKQAELARTTYGLVVQEFVSNKSDLSSVIQVQRQLLDYGLKESDAIADYNTMVANIQKLISKSE